jgi:hypothetical protein
MTTQARDQGETNHELSFLKRRAELDGSPEGAIRGCCCELEVETDRDPYGRRILPGLECVITGAAMAARELSWEVVGIRDGYEGLLFADRYPQGGTFSTQLPLATLAS